MIYAGYYDQIYIRQANQSTFIKGKTLPKLGSTRTPSSFGFGPIRDIIVDPNNWMQAFAVTGNKNGKVTILQTVDGGVTWIPIGGNLKFNIFTLEYIPAANDQVSGCGLATSTGANVLLAGGAGGVYRTLNPNQAPAKWVQVGQNLPNTIVHDLKYDVCDDLLIAGTLGRGIWAITDAADQVAEADITITGDAAIDDTIELELDGGSRRG